MHAKRAWFFAYAGDRNDCLAVQSNEMEPAEPIAAQRNQLVLV